MIGPDRPRGARAPLAHQRADRDGSRALFVLALCATFAFSLAPRLEQLDRWRNRPQEYYAGSVPVSGSDSYYWFRMAREHAEGQPLRGRDALRHYPDGADYEGVPALSRLLAGLSRWTGGDVYRAGILATLVLSSLFVVPLGFFCLRLGHPAAGVVGALLASFSPAYLYRSSIRHTDTDGGNLFFVWTIAALCAWVTPEARARRNALLASLGGLSLASFCGWYGQPVLWLPFAAAFAVHLVAARFAPRRALGLLALFIALSNPLHALGAVRDLAAVTSQYVLGARTAPAGEHATAALAFPNVYREIDELGRLPPARTLSEIVRSPALAAAGLAAFGLLAAAHWRCLVPVLPVLALGALGPTRAFRFTMYLAPFVGIGLGFLVSLAARRLVGGRRAPLLDLAAYGLAFALVAALLGLTAWDHPRRSQTSPRLLASLIELRQQLPADAAIWTSWSFGYVIADVARAATFDDPRDPDPVIAQLMSRSMVSDDPAELAHIVSFVANRGREGLARLASGSRSYPELLESLAERAGPPPGNAYVLFVARMIDEYPAYHYKGLWDFEARTGTRDGYEIHRCERTLTDVLVCGRRAGREIVIDLARGLIAGRRFARKAVFVAQGAVRAEIDYASDDGPFVQVIEGADRSVSVQILTESVFRSNFNQMFVLGRWDPALFEEAYARVPDARLFRLRSP